jgi:2-polyprenyl-3-methyl-5-hydroxy-6-metoxy-1,4-benzoquinol methylase
MPFYTGALKYLLLSRKDKKSMSKACGICGSNGDHLQYNAREMMFGSRERFNYFQCVDCGCLQLAEIPADLSRFYPSNYYSFSDQGQNRNGISQWLYRHWVRYLITGESFIGKIASILKNKKLPIYDVFRLAGMRREQKILDVGSGAGSTLYPLKEAGFDHLMGSDEFIAEDIKYDNGLLIKKANLFDIAETNWDMIMLNHCFEHLPKQQEHMRQIHQLLRPGGVCLIRIPTVSSYAWEHYRENWVQLDAPRHFYLHSHKSITLLAEQAGFQVKDIVQDSTGFQFAGSEQYLQDIPLFGDPASYLEGNTNTFSAAQWQEFEARAEQLNRDNRGDSIGVILVRKG